jgi:periplasmic protein TonB
MFESPPHIRQPFAKIATSIALHCGVIALLIHQFASHPITVVTLPGTPLGTHLEIAYLPGRPPSPALSAHSKTKPAPSSPKLVQPKAAETITPSAATLAPPPPRPHLAFSPPTPTLSNAPTSAAPDATVGSDSLGNGNIQIALTTYSPSPRPDLSRLPRGTQGDVILDVTIDPDGKVADVAVVRTLGYGIDEAVINTVRTWLFRPATKDGRPVASAQDVLFHYGPV